MAYLVEDDAIPGPSCSGSSMLTENEDFEFEVSYIYYL